MKVLLKWSIALILMATTPAMGAELFSDVTGNHKNTHAIQYLKHKNIIQGYEDGSFKPGNTVNRAEFLKILIEGKGLNIAEEGHQNCFDDVTTEWYAKYVCYAKNQEWVEGYEDGSFKPWQEVNKVEALKMLLEVHDYRNMLDSVDTQYLYEDTEVDSWYAPYVAAAKKMNILEETGSMFTPAGDMSRGSISEVLFRTMVLKELNFESFLPEQVEEAFNRAQLEYVPMTTAAPEEPVETSEEPVDNNQGIAVGEPYPMKQKNEMKPFTDLIPLQSGVSIQFAEMGIEGSDMSETFAVLSTSPSQKITWDTLKGNLATLAPTFDQLLQIIELISWQEAVDSMGRYASTEVLSAEMDDTGSTIIEVEWNDDCYGSKIVQYFYRDGMGIVESQVIQQEAAKVTCSN